MIAHLLVVLVLISVGNGVKVRLLVPKFVRANTAVTLVCQYDLGGKPLYAVKWYRGSHEFFRYIPQAKPSMVSFPVPGLYVDLPGSSTHQVTLLNVPLSISGLVTCEVSTDVTFSTASDSANLTVIDLGLRKPTLHLSSSVLKADTNLQINCSAQVTDPPPTISLYIDNRKVDPSLVEHLGPGLAGLSLSVLEEHFNAGDLLPVRPIWVRCEASVRGIYFLTSASVPILPEFETKPSPEEEMSDVELVISSLAATSSTNWFWVGFVISVHLTFRRYSI